MAGIFGRESSVVELTSSWVCQNPDLLSFRHVVRLVVIFSGNLCCDGLHLWLGSEWEVDILLVAWESGGYCSIRILYR